MHLCLYKAPKRGGEVKGCCCMGPGQTELSLVSYIVGGCMGERGFGGGLLSPRCWGLAAEYEKCMVCSLLACAKRV